MQRIHLKLPASYRDQDVQVFGECFDAVSFTAIREDNNHTADWGVDWIIDTPIKHDHAAQTLIEYAAACNLQLPQAPDISLSQIEDQNWLELCYQSLPAFAVDDFFVYGSHYTHPPPADKIGLQIDAATAFGSGDHGTTKGCLMAMQWLKDEGLCPWQILDMGTGSGILAIAAWKLWKTPTLAVDNDPESVKSAIHHRDINGVPAGKMDMECALGDGFNAIDAQTRKPYELVIANILASALKDMVHDLKSICDDNARVILSGILNEQAQGVIDIYTAEGLSVINSITIGDWTTLILKT